MVVVAKPNKIRIFLAPKDLNKALKRPKYQMPTLEERIGGDRAPVAQLVEHRVVMREVVSSTPAGPTLRVLK